MRALAGLLMIGGCSFTPPSGVAVDATPSSTDDGLTIDGPLEIDALQCSKPITHWQFDEGTGTSAGDATGHGNALTLMGSATWGAGHTGGALSLAGGGWAEVPYNETFAATRKLSATAWINPVSSLNTGAIVIKSARLGPFADWGFYHQGDEALFIYNFPTPDIRGLTSEMGIPADQWTHLAFVLDVDAGTTSFYINGVFHSTRAMTVDLLQHNTEPIIVGTDGGNTANDFLGLIDEVTVWNRALSATEVATVHDGGCIIE